MRKSRVALLIIVTASLAAAAGAAAFALSWYRQPLPLPRSPFEFEVRAGAPLTTVARTLREAGVIPHPYALTLLARAKGVDRAIKAGNYELETGITLSGLLAKLTQGDVTQTAVTIVEGTTFAEVRRALRATPDVRHEVADLPDAELLQRMGAVETSPEGILFPDTYFLATGSSDLALLRRAYRSLHARLDAAWARRAPDLPFASPYEALILASIVEKETAHPDDRPLIASVFVNRLKRGMRLQTDPTVIYGMGPRFDGNQRKRDLEADTPYNTYVRDGLPPTPIALPSQASIDVVMNPPKTAYIYFVSRGDGTSEFSANLADHNRAVSKYQKGGR
jgi:UPF0755 protein